MKLKSLRLQNFRSYTDQTFEFDSDQLIFCGPNGIGKTNILEAISVLSVGKSWREQSGKDLVQLQSDSAQITAHLAEHQQYQVQIASRQRRFLKNEKVTTRPKFIGQIPTLLFCPEYLQILTGPKSPRVQFFDRFLIQCNPHYRAALQKANKAHKQKTSLLRSLRHEERPRDMATALLAPWNQILAETMPVITGIRNESLEILNPMLQSALAQMAPNKDLVQIKLIAAEAVIMETAQILDWFRANESLEIAAAKNFIAPSRDDFQFQLREQALASTASRGEVRTVLLALLNAQKHFLKARCGVMPILLLDDVFSELDDHRQAQLEALCDGSQVFFTTTHKEHFDRFHKSVQVFDFEV